MTAARRPGTGEGTSHSQAAAGFAETRFLWPALQQVKENIFSKCLEIVYD